MPVYPVPTSRRIPYDIDGTVVIEYNPSSGSQYVLTATQRSDLVSDANTGWISGNGTFSGAFRPGQTYWYFFFPAPRDLTHLALWWFPFHGGWTDIQYSTDATSIGTGTWTNVGYSTSGENNFSTGVNYRTWPQAFSLTGVRALRFAFAMSDGNDQLGSFHVYGRRSSSDTSDQVGFCDSTGARFAADFDFGDMVGGATLKWKAGTLFSAPDQLYVKNYAAAHTANSVVVGRQVVGVDSGNLTQIVGELQVSLDDVTYANSLTIASMAAGALVGPIYLRYASLSSDALGLKVARLTTTVGSWT